jgi:hypothetical protein
MKRPQFLTAGSASNVLAGVVALSALIILLPVVSDSQDRRSSQEAEGQTRTYLANGQWLVTGGRYADGRFAPAFLMDTETGQTRKTASQPVWSRMHHTATVLPDGRVFLFGGVGPDGHTMSAAELYDPEDGGFSQVRGIVALEDRAYHSATLLTDGKLLIAGGRAGSPARGWVALSAVEIWNHRNQEAMTLDAQVLEARETSVGARLLASGSVLLDSSQMYDPNLGVFLRPDGTGAVPEAQFVVAGSYPDQRSGPVDTEPVVGIRFSTPVAPNSVTPNSVRLIDSAGTRVQSRLVTAEGGMLIFLTPKEDLALSSSYTVEIDGVRPAAGGEAVRYTAISFHTMSEAELLVDAVLNHKKTLPQVVDTSKITMIKTFVGCLNSELLPKATTDIADTVTSCLPNKLCRVTVTMSRESLQPACTIGTTKFPRIILDCPGPAADKRFRPSYMLCPNIQDNDGKPRMDRVEIGQDNQKVTFAANRANGRGFLVMANIPVPQGKKLAKVDFNQVVSMGNGTGSEGTIGCESFCHKEPSPPKSATTVIQTHPPINPFSTDFRGADLTPFVIYTDHKDAKEYPGLEKIPAGARGDFENICKAITANKAAINAADKSIKIETLNQSEKLCNALLSRTN